MQEGVDDTGRVSRVQVVVRVRPLLPSEIQQEVAVSCAPDGSKVQVLLPQRGGDKDQLPGANRSGAKSFKFDACLPGSTSQEDLFSTCGMQELVDAALDGYSVTIFAFGQTGSGKTHTMIGPRLSRAAEAGAKAAGAGAGPGASGDTSEDGVLPRCVQYAYESITARAGEADFTVTASCLELYNETVTDLLGKDTAKQLQVRKDERDGFQVMGLSQLPCPTSTAALRHMHRALQLRQTRSHRLNDYSSRSHCLVTFVFSSQECVGGEGADQRQQGAKGGVRRYGKLVLVDLAGSERLKETGNTDRDAVRETGFINKSLFTLGQVLAALCARSSGSAPFVPYRDSKLTQLLWDGLRGSGRALMLACLGPTMGFADESLNTLHFASMAQRIKASPVVLLDPQDQLVLDLRNTIRQLQDENRQLASSLQHLSAGADIHDVIDMLPDKLRAAAGAPGAPPDSAPAASSTRPPATQQQHHHARHGGVGSNSVGSSPAHPSAPWRSADDSTLPPTPTNANVFKLAPLPAVSFSPPAQHGRSKANGSGGKASGSSRHAAQQGGSPFQRRPEDEDPTGRPPRGGAAAWAPSTSRSSDLSASTGGRTPAGGGHAAAAARHQQQGQQQQQQRRSAQSQPRGSSQQPRRTSDPEPSPRSGGGAMQCIFQDLGASSSSASAAAGAPGRSAGGGARRSYANPKLKAGASPGLRGSGAAAAGGVDPGPLLRPPVPLLDADLFPELAAMEAEFQLTLASGVAGAGNAGGAPSSSGAPEITTGGKKRASAPSAVRATVKGLIEGGVGATAPEAPGHDRAAAAGGGVDGPEASGSPGADGGGGSADLAALKWARKHTWFGSDMVLTAHAYQVHDQLVDAEHVDPVSDIYYMELERRVANKFPDRWAAWWQQRERDERERREQREAAQPAEPAVVHAFGRALRVAVKDALPGASAGQGGGGSGGGAAAGGSMLAGGRLHGFRNFNAAQAWPERAPDAAAAAGKLPAAAGSASRSVGDSAGSASSEPGASSSGGGGCLAAAAGVARSGPPARSRSLQGPSAASSSSGPAAAPSASMAPQGRRSGPAVSPTTSVPAPARPPLSSPSASPPSSDLNPFNLHAINPAAPSHSAAGASPKRKPKRSHARDGAAGGRTAAAGRPTLELPAFDATSYEDMQAEYLRQRALVVAELRQAKEQAETERARIMQSLGKVLGASRWRQR